MLSHISVLFQGTTQLHNFASHDIHPTSSTHSSYLSLPFWRWTPRTYGYRTTRFSQNISSIKLGLQKTHRSIYSINQSQFQTDLFCHNLRVLHWRKEKKKIYFPTGRGDKTYHGIKPIKVNAHKTSQPCWLIRGLDLKQICLSYFIFKDKSFCCNMMRNKLNWLQK